MSKCAYKYAMVEKMFYNMVDGPDVILKFDRDKVIILYNGTFTCANTPFCAMATYHRATRDNFMNALDPIEILKFSCTNKNEMHHQKVVELPRNGSQWNTMNEVHINIYTNCHKIDQRFSSLQRLPGPDGLALFDTFSYNMNLTKFEKNYSSPQRFKDAFIRSNSGELDENFDQWIDGKNPNMSKFFMDN
ncbi:hypothetical protein L5515_017332 [Caenorhabditis briggsae]|uniref:Uncharacterized protein n=1 Tax=Caenorhabditis briggsae TaxID=6238 RepID=A0AAE9FJ83_CAEBR|nr:hypothetical protein L5515_017332 [Caenorhabditis briggsae]